MRFRGRGESKPSKSVEDKPVSTVCDQAGQLSDFNRLDGVIIEAGLTRLPEELRAARWLLREREEFLAKVQREGDDILDAARGRAERMVQRAEVVRAAQHTARRLVEEAEAESRRLRHEAEDYCDHKLAQFEIILDRTIKTVQAGRSRLHQSPLGDEPQPEPQYEGADLYDMGTEEQ